MILWHAENEFLVVTIDDDGSAEIVDRQTGERWRMGRVAQQDESMVDVGHCWLRTERSPCEVYPGRFQGEVQGTALRFTLSGFQKERIGQFSVELHLEGRWLDFRIFDIEDSIPSLVFPPPIVSESLIVPQNVGCWIKEPLPLPNWWIYPVHLRMRWFGGLRGDHGWMAILHEGAADGGAMCTQLSLSPAWLRSMGQWGNSRTVRYCFTSGGYVGMAKSYRAYAIEHGMFRSLRDKLNMSPNAARFVGGDVLSFFMSEARHPARYEDRNQPVPVDVPLEGKSPDTYVRYADACRLIEQSMSLGVSNGLIVLRGWINGGYDESHPDIFPYEPSLGSTDELRDLLHYGGADSPWLVALHDNYQDIYPQSSSFPDGVIRNLKGELMRGGIWAGGQSYLINARDGVKNARRNWAELSKIEPHAMFIDTTTAVQWYEDYTPDQHQTRSDDRAAKIELLTYFRDQGQIVGSEEVSDFGAPLVEWFENRHARIPGISIPLWGLVYHDSAFCTRYLRPVNDFLTDMLWGYLLFWDFREPATWAANLNAIPHTRAAAAWHRRIGLDEMLDHQYLSDDGQVERTVFSSGAAITINFATEPQTIDGLTLAAGGFSIQD